MAKKVAPRNAEIDFDGKSYDIRKLSEFAKNHLDMLEFVNQEISQRNNELQVADSARIIYASVLKSELKQL